MAGNPSQIEAHSLLDGYFDVLLARRRAEPQKDAQMQVPAEHAYEALCGLLRVVDRNVAALGEMIQDLCKISAASPWAAVEERRGDVRQSRAFRDDDAVESEGHRRHDDLRDLPAEGDKVPGLRRQWWHRFVHRKHKHVFAMRPTSMGNWLLVEPWWSRMMVTILPPADAVKFLRWGDTGDILRVREAIPGAGNQFRGWSNCAALIAFVLGRSSWTWSPHGLYRQLLREKATRLESAEQLLVDQFTNVVSQYVASALSVGADQLSLPLRELLTIIGRNLLQAMMTHWRSATPRSWRLTGIRGRRRSMPSMAPSRPSRRWRRSWRTRKEAGKWI
jgi:hypothetical protein